MDQQTAVVIALLIVGPALMVWTSRATVQPRHAAIHAALAVLLGAVAWGCFAFVKPGQGMAGLLAGVAGLGAGALAVAFLSAAASVVIAMATRGASPPKGRRPQGHQPPLLAEYRRWQRSTHQPNASYEDFLQKAHPRRFPASAATVIVAIVLMVLVFVLVLQR